MRRLASFAASLECPIALHVVFIAFTNPFVVASSLSVLLSLIFSRSEIDNVDNYSPKEWPSTFDLHVITPVWYDMCLLNM